MSIISRDDIVGVLTGGETYCDNCMKDPHEYTEDLILLRSAVIDRKLVYYCDKCGKAILNLN